MKLTRLAPVACALLSAAAIALLCARGTRAAVQGGVVTSCTDAGLSAALVGGGDITFDCGNSFAPAVIVVSTTKTIAIDTNIDGSNGGNPITLTAPGGVRLFFVNSGSALTLANLAVTGLNFGGIPIWNQGGLFITNSAFISNSSSVIYNTGALTVSNALFFSNYGGGAIYNVTHGAVSVSAGRFYSNASGAIFSSSDRPVAVDGTAFMANHAFQGGAIYMAGASTMLSLTSVAFVSNTTTSDGSALWDDSGSASISNTTFISNSSAGQGGAIWYQAYGGSGVRMISATFELNTGGAIYVNTGTGVPFDITDSRFVSNTSAYFAPAIHAATLSLTLTRSIFSGNRTAGNDAGAVGSGGPVFITGSTFISNSGNQGGALYLGNAGIPPFVDQVLNTVVQSNTASLLGGGIVQYNELRLDGVNLAGNTTTGDGGGLYAYSSHLTVTHSLFAGNRAGSSATGGAIRGASVELVNTTVYSNSAFTTGGISAQNTLDLLNSTLMSNTATQGAGNISNPGAPGQLTLKNTILGGGSPVNCVGPMTSLGHNLSSDSSCPITATSDLTGVNPLLGPFQDNGGPTNTMLPLPASPAVNGGDNAGCPPDDQRYVPRPQAGTCDIGAVESPYYRMLQLFLPLTRR